MAAFLIGYPPGQRERAGELDLGGGGRPEQQTGRGGLADEQRVDPQPQFVEQPVFEQSLGQLAEPYWTMSWPGCSFRRRIAAIGSPLITAVLFRSGSRSVLGTTYLVVLLIRSL